MKKTLALILSLTIVAALFCGCSMESEIVVKKNGKCVEKAVIAIPEKDVKEMVKSMKELEAENEPDKEKTDEEMIKEMLGDDFVLTTYNGKKCYVTEEKENYSSFKKVNKKMLEADEDTGATPFKTFNLDTVGFTATIDKDVTSASAAAYKGLKYNFKVTFPTKIVKTNGKLSKDKKTVTFNILKKSKLYAHTVNFKVKKATPGKKKAKLTWTKIKGAKKYTVKYKASGDKKWKTAKVKSTAKTFKKLKAGKKYTFKITAKSAGGNEYSAKKTVKIK